LWSSRVHLLQQFCFFQLVVEFWISSCSSFVVFELWSFGVQLLLAVFCCFELWGFVALDQEEEPQIPVGCVCVREREREIED
jgi:hypothetical protein